MSYAICKMTGDGSQGHFIGEIVETTMDYEHAKSQLQQYRAVANCDEYYLIARPVTADGAVIDVLLDEYLKQKGQSFTLYFSND